MRRRPTALPTGRVGRRLRGGRGRRSSDITEGRRRPPLGQTKVKGDLVQSIRGGHVGQSEAVADGPERGMQGTDQTVHQQPPPPFEIRGRRPNRSQVDGLALQLLRHRLVQLGGEIEGGKVDHFQHRVDQRSDRCSRGQVGQRADKSEIFRRKGGACRWRRRNGRASSSSSNPPSSDVLVVGHGRVGRVGTGPGGGVGDGRERPTTLGPVGRCSEDRHLQLGSGLIPGLSPPTARPPRGDGRWSR